MIKRGGKWGQLGTMALVAVPWFFRDELATKLDEHTRDVQAVLAEKSNHEQRQQQDSDQREIRDLLTRIDLTQKANNQEVSPEKAQAEAAEHWGRTARDEGSALAEDAESLRTLGERVSMGDDARKTLDTTTASADGIAVQLKALEVKADATEEDDKKIEALLAGYGTADEALGQAWASLASAAENDEKTSQSLATTTRFIAWLFTAIGALLAGDWKKLGAGIVGREEDA